MELLTQGSVLGPLTHIDITLTQIIRTMSAD